MSNQPDTHDQDDDDWLHALNADGDGHGPEAEKARALIAAMREAADALEPSEATCDAAWRRIEAEMATYKEKNLRPAWWRTFFTPPTLGWVAASVAAVVGLAVWLHVPQEPEFDIVAMRGTAQRVPISDFSETSPVLVEELRALGIEVQTQRMTEGIYVNASIPSPTPLGLSPWLARWHVEPPIGHSLTLILVPAAAK